MCLPPAGVTFPTLKQNKTKKNPNNQKTKLKTKDDSKVDPRFLIKALPLQPEYSLEHTRVNDPGMFSRRRETGLTLEIQGFYLQEKVSKINCLHFPKPVFGSGHLHTSKC